MPIEVDDELRALRARAYGPHADIQDHAVALRRLRELEGAARFPPAAPPPARIADGVPPNELPESPPPAAVVAAPQVEEPRVQDEDPKARARRMLPLFWIASVLVAILLAVLLSREFIQRIQIDPQSVGATQVTRLDVDPGAELPDFFSDGGGGDFQAFSEFYGLRVLVSSDGGFWGTTPGSTDECMFVITSEAWAASTDGSLNGPILDGCAANAFPATVELKVTRDSPDELRDAFPVGSALQFVYDELGADVVVYTSAGREP